MLRTNLAKRHDERLHRVTGAYAPAPTSRRAGLLVLGESGTPAVASVHSMSTPPITREIRCDDSPTQKVENIPSDTVDSGHDVLHAFSVLHGGVVLAWVYQDRNGTMWFQGNGRNAAYSQIAATARLFGAKMTPKVSGGYAQQISGKISAGELKGSRVTLHGCF